MHSYADDAEWARFLPLPTPYTREHSEQFVARQLLLPWDQHPSWAIEHEARVVGGINLRFSENERIGEVGYAVARRVWGSGLATEALCSVIDAAFSACPELARIRATADPRNGASLRVMEKAGMRREGTLRKNRYTRGEPADEVWCGLLRGEWKQE